MRWEEDSRGDRRREEDRRQEDGRRAEDGRSDRRQASGRHQDIRRGDFSVAFSSYSYSRREMSIFARLVIFGVDGKVETVMIMSAMANRDMRTAVVVAMAVGELARGGSVAVAPGETTAFTITYQVHM